jgi:hypothetical protein
MARSTLFAAVFFCAVAACRTVTPAPSPDAPTLMLEDYAFNLSPHHGETVRVCGRIVQVRSHWAIEHVRQEGELFFHGAPAIFLAWSGSRAPRLDRNGCITGRIAREDGSLVPPVQPTNTSDAPYDYDWFLHPLNAGGR